MIKQVLSIHAAASILLIAVSARADATEIYQMPLQQEEKCSFVTRLVASFQDPEEATVQPAGIKSLWNKRLARQVMQVDELVAYLTTIGVGVYSGEQLLDLDMRQDRISVFILKSGRMIASCG